MSTEASAAAGASSVESCGQASSGSGLQQVLQLEATSSRATLAQLGADSCDGVGDECRKLGDATPASPAACPLPGSCQPSADSAGVAASAPRIYTYDCMDATHARLLAQPHVAEFFDANLPRNQFLSEVALHRSILVRCSGTPSRWAWRSSCWAWRCSESGLTSRRRA